MCLIFVLTIFSSLIFILFLFCNHCNSNCFLLSSNFERFYHLVVYVALPLHGLHWLWLFFFVFPLIISEALYMYITIQLFQSCISIWDFNVIRFFKFHIVCMRLNISISNFCIARLLTDSLSPSFICQDVMNVTAWCGKIYCSHIIVITNGTWILIPDCWFENIFSFYFCIYQTPAPIPHKSYPFVIITFIFDWCMQILYNSITLTASY